MSQSSTDEYSQSSSDGGYLASKIAAYQLSRSIDGFSHRPDTPLSDNALYSAALEAATEMRLRCGISSSCPAQLWTTHESTQSLRTDCPQVSEARIQFVEAMKSSWRPLGTDRIELPQEWISDSQQLKLGGDLSLSMLQIVTHPVRDALTPLSPHDRVPRMRKIAHCKPDFTYPRIPQGQWKADDPPDTAVSASRVLDVVTQFGDTRADRLDLCVASIFDGMPGFILRRNPVFCFYPCLGTSEDASIDYALVLLPVSPTRRLTRKKARVLPVGILNPALLLHISELDPPSVDRSTSSRMVATDLMRLARNTQRHLDALLVAFSLRHSQGVSTADIPTPASPRDPPPWAIMYGIFQKCDTVHIVAHLPSWDPSTHECHYHAILVDSLPFAPRTTSMQSPEQTLARLRVAIALLTIQKHCARLRAVWEDGLPGLAWPQAIVDYERALADEVTGIVSPMPSVETDVELDYIMFYDPWLDENEPFDTGADEEDMRRSRVIVKRWLRGKPVHQ